MLYFYHDVALSVKRLFSSPNANVNYRASSVNFRASFGSPFCDSYMKASGFTLSLSDLGDFSLYESFITFV